MYVIAIVFSWVCDKSFLRYMYEAKKVATPKSVIPCAPILSLCISAFLETILLLFGCSFHFHLLTHQVVQKTICHIILRLNGTDVMNSEKRFASTGYMIMFRGARNRCTCMPVSELLPIVKLKLLLFSTFATVVLHFF